MEIDARGLNLTPNGTGDAPAGMPGLWEVVVTNWLGNGNPGKAWLLDAEDVGIGGENGNGGYGAADGCRLSVETGEIDGGGGSSSPNETPRARSFASFNSSTYLFHAMAIVSIFQSNLTPSQSDTYHQDQEEPLSNCDPAAPLPCPLGLAKHLCSANSPGSGQTRKAAHKGQIRGCCSPALARSS